MTDHIITLHPGETVRVQTSSGGTICDVGHWTQREDSIVELFDRNTLVTGPGPTDPEIRARELLDDELQPVTDTLENDADDIFGDAQTMLTRLREAIPGGNQTSLQFQPVVHGVDGHASCIWIDVEDNVVVANDRGEGVVLTKGDMPETIEAVLLALTGPDPESVELVEELRSTLYRFDDNKVSSDLSVWVPGLGGRATRVYVNYIGDVSVVNRNAEEVRISGFTPASIVRSLLKVVTRLANPA